MVAPTQMPVACFAPPLSDEKLARYRELAEGLPEADRVRDAMLTMLDCVETWWDLPESKRKDASRLKIVHGGKAVTVPITPLEEKHVKVLWEVTPWMDELNALSTANDDGPLDALPPGELRDAAFHLLWHCKEITLDREPVTSDRLA